jgi:hypothetical protein
MVKGFKVLASLVSAVLLATVVVGSVFAQGPVEDGDGFGRGRGYGFVDEDGDGINDRYMSNPEFVDEDGDGVCDTHGVEPGEGDGQELGYGRGQGYGFVDEDGDGINDRYGTNPEFVDKDGDGVCDTHGVEQGEGDGQGYGRRFRVDGDEQRAPMAGRGRMGRQAAGQ